MEIQPSVTRTSSQGVSVFIFPLYSYTILFLFTSAVLLLSITTTVFFWVELWGVRLYIPLLDHQPAFSGTDTYTHKHTSTSPQNKQNDAWVNWVVILSPITICLSHLVYLPFYIRKWTSFSISTKLIGQKWLENATPPLHQSLHLTVSTVSFTDTWIHWKTWLLYCGYFKRYKVCYKVHIILACLAILNWLCIILFTISIHWYNTNGF